MARRRVTSFDLPTLQGCFGARLGEKHLAGILDQYSRRLVGIATRCAAVTLIAILSTVARLDARISEMGQDFAEGELAYGTRIREGFFTESALLSRWEGITVRIVA